MEDVPQQPDTKTEWAERRTDWAEDRTVLANERTFAGWLRTGLAAVAVAIGFQAVVSDFEPTWAAKTVATMFLVAALVIFWAARQEFCRIRRGFERTNAETQSARRVTVLATLLILATLGAGGIVWAL